MSLEEQIVEWGATRPSWQRSVLRRVARGELLSDEDYDQIVEELVTSKPTEEATFSLSHLPQVDAGDPPVRLLSISNPEHVNALVSDEPLTFEPTGLSIIYGDNASGKSGYARLLKRIARVRHQEEVLSDVFRDTALAKPKAALTVMIGGEEKTFMWPDSSVMELRHMLFYDEACGDAYIATESDFPYRPSALFVMDGLIEACIGIRNRIDAKLEENARSANALPSVDDDLTETEIGKYLTQLSGSSSVEALDRLIGTIDESLENIDDLKNAEASLRSEDKSKERQKLVRQADKLDSLRTHLDNLQQALGDNTVTALQEERNRLMALEEAATLLAKSFESEPLRGVGTSPWKELWESARRFSETQAYPDTTFPVIAGVANCVLCQQTLEDEARKRLSRFERFVQEDTQVRLREAHENWDAHVENLKNLQTRSETVETNLKDLEPDHLKLVRQVRELLTTYGDERERIIEAIGGTEDLPQSGLTPVNITSRLETAAEVARTAAEGLSNPQSIKQRLATITTERKELELAQEAMNKRKGIVDEIVRLKEREALEAIKGAAATGPITMKILLLSEENITEVVRDTFTRETDRLHLERVTIAKTRAHKGALLHQPKLVGARQNVTLPRIFSEGEQTALGLAAFFTDANLDASKSALILDDPVSSLDHIRRGLVAARLAAFAETRQVVVFTHDISFVSELKREAKGLDVSVSERSVTRGRGGDKKPGRCSTTHPWKAKDVAERLNELRTGLARIRRECQHWDEATYEIEVATWAGNLSETWERVFSQELVGPLLAEGGLEVRPNMVKILARFSEADEREFQTSYSRTSQWAKRHDKSAKVNYVAPEVTTLEEEFELMNAWFRRVKAYKS